MKHLSETKNALNSEKMRKKLKSVNDLNFDMDLSDAFFDKMHDKIMQKVEMTEIEAKNIWDGPKKYLRSHYRGWLYCGVSMCSILAVAILLRLHAGVVQPKSILADLDSRTVELMLAAQAEAPEVFSNTVLGDGAGAQFFVDAASDSFENLNISQVRLLMGE